MTWVTRFRSTPTSPRPSHRGSPRTTTSTTCSQIAGEKQWFIHEPVFESPLRSQPWNDRSTAVAEAATQAPVIDTVLRPGDALYLPRGYLHSAKALGGVSVHLTVGIHPVTRYALVEALLALAADDLSLRTSLPLESTYPTPRQ